MMLYRKHWNETIIESYQTNINDYNNTYPFHLGTFDVDNCQKSSDPLQIALTIKVQNYSEVKSDISSFQNGIRDAFSCLLNSSSLLFTDVQVAEETVSNQLKVSLAIREWLNVTGKLDDKFVKLSAKVLEDLKNRQRTKNVKVAVTFAGKTQVCTQISKFKSIFQNF
jgi:hypothetical protein